MTIEKRVTDLPTVASAQLTDIVMAVQGYVNPMNIGISVQETWAQVLSLMQSNIILFNAGNPNGAVAGVTYQLCWDTTDMVLFICTTSGTTSTAVWTQISNSSTSSFNWVPVNSSVSPTLMTTNTGYFANASGLITFVLPAVSKLGDIIKIVGISSSGWTLTFTSGQAVVVGSSTATTTTGSVSSTNRFDSIQLVCVQNNLSWHADVAPQGNLTIV